MNRENCPFSEKFLQILWNERHLRRELTTTDGHSVRIVSPGTWNNTAGPDFSHAAILLDHQLYRGDVEIHRYSSDWERHGHIGNPAYQNVILHAVWKEDFPKPDGIPATLELSKALDANWEALFELMEENGYPRAQQIPPGDCSLSWALTEDNKVKELLALAGLFRFSAKKERLRQIAAESSEEEMLYQAIFDVMGYRNNRGAFRSLARRVPLALLKKLPAMEERISLLFGAAGLLPDPTQTAILPDWQIPLQRFWSLWWKEESMVSNIKRNSEKICWNKGGNRPCNSPERRLLAAIQILEMMKYNPPLWLDKMAACSSSGKELLKNLRSSLIPKKEENPFHSTGVKWRAFKNFSRSLSPAAELLGENRFRELLANVLLPWLSGQSGREELARDAFLQLPSGQENRLCREAALRFFIPPSRMKKLVRASHLQQGLISLYQNFCLALNNDCRSCPLCKGST